MVGWLLVGWLLQNRFVDLWVERLTDRFDLLAIVLFEHGQQLLADELETFEQAVGFARLFGGFDLLGRLDGAIDIIEDWQQVADDRQRRVAAFVDDFAGGATAEVFHLGLQAKHAIFFGRQFGFDFVGRLGAISIIGARLLNRFGKGVGFGRGGIVFVFGWQGIIPHKLFLNRYSKGTHTSTTRKQVGFQGRQKAHSLARRACNGLRGLRGILSFGFIRAKILFHLVEKTFAFRRDVFVFEFGQLTKQVGFFAGDLFWHLDVDLH